MVPPARNLDVAPLENPLAAARRRWEEAIALRPDDARAHAELGQLLALTGELERASSHARRAAELSPADPQIAMALVNVLEADRQYQQAIQIVDRLMMTSDRSTPVALAYVRLAQELNREVEALDWLLQLLEVGLPRPPREKASLHFAAANLLDRLQRYDEAFQHATQANQTPGVKYDRALVERVANSTIDYFDRKTVRRLPRATYRSQVPIFIVGMARSGTSLIEQVLASHPSVYGGGESDGIYRVWASTVQRLSSPNLPLHHSLDEIMPAHADALAAEYLGPLQALAPRASHVTDKTPSNAAHLGLIATLFPNARLIHSRRDPLDTGISCYLTDFAMGNAFSHDLSSIAHFQRLTDQLMSHWKSVLDLSILEVDYEKFVADPRKQIRRLLDFVGLPWDDRCLNFHKNRRVVATASQAQVRRPIYDTSIGRWRNYRKWLGPLSDGLDQHHG